MDFTCDPTKLIDVSENVMQPLAQTLREAGHALVEGTEEYWAEAFREDRTPLESMYATTAHAWSTACNDFFDVLCEAARRIDRAADVLDTTAKNYAAADHAAAVRAAELLDLLEHR
jgi:hypothetical protein